MHIFLQIKNNNLIYVVHIRCSIVKKGTIIATVPLLHMNFTVLSGSAISGGMLYVCEAFRRAGTG